MMISYRSFWAGLMICTSAALGGVSADPVANQDALFVGDLDRDTIEVRMNDEMLSTLEIGDPVEIGVIHGAELRGYVDWSDARSMGGVIGEDEGSFLFVVRDEIVSGYVRIEHVGVYELMGERGEALEVILSGEGAFATCAGGLVVGEEMNNEGVEGKIIGDTIEHSHEAMGESVAMIDVLVVYTEEAKNARGGTNQMLAFIDLAIASANRAYVNSHIGSELRLVHTQEVEYDENTSSYGAHLSRLRNNDGMIDEAHELREEYGADMVSLFVNDRRSCGQAYLMRSISTSFANRAFSVVSWNCAVGNMTFAHELGHNMGACHAPDDPCSGGAHSYSFGHRFGGSNNTRWRSVMAYSPGTRVEYFSNPDVMLNGDPTGVLGVSFNARTLDLSTPTVAQFRDEASDCRVDLTGEGNVDFFDISVFISYYNGLVDEADFTGDGEWNFFDVSAFMLEFAAGCP